MQTQKARKILRSSFLLTTLKCERLDSIGFFVDSIYSIYHFTNGKQTDEYCSLNCILEFVLSSLEGKMTVEVTKSWSVAVYFRTFYQYC